ncbi:MAG: helix-turn-helix transcriptional regulator [Oscillospiraceae bacterium]|nr:helix-turn-helix transcriptional regulator [Oscillospiraceae bacterium]
MTDKNTEGQAMAEIGKNIAKLRKQGNLTQDQLADMVGVSPQAVSKWENELSCPDITLLPSISKIFGVSVDELLGNEITDEKIRETQNNYEKASKNDGRFNMARQIKITVTKPDGKETNVTLPSMVVNFGMKLGIAFGGVNSEQLEVIKDAVQSGLTGEILKVETENDETVIIKIE